MGSTERTGPMLAHRPSSDALPARGKFGIRLNRLGDATMLQHTHDLRKRLGQTLKCTAEVFGDLLFRQQDAFARDHGWTVTGTWCGLGRRYHCPHASRPQPEPPLGTDNRAVRGRQSP